MFLITIESPLANLVECTQHVNTETFVQAHAHTLCCTHFACSANKLGPGGGTAIGEALTALTSLTSLSLGCNELGTAGATALAESLSLLTELHSLDLWDNNIGATGAASICCAARGLGCICLGVPLDVARAALLSGGSSLSRVNMPKVDCEDRIGGVEWGKERGVGKDGDWLEVRALLLAGGASIAMQEHGLRGLRKLYDAPYYHKTDSKALLAAATAAGCTHVVVAAARSGAEGGVLKVAAAGALEAALGGTAGGETRLSHGVHWYCSRERGFGFAPNDDITLDPSNPRDSNHPTDPLRLSWRVDGKHGGYRAGDERDLFCSTKYRKVIWGFRL